MVATPNSFFFKFLFWFVVPSQYQLRHSVHKNAMKAYKDLLNQSIRNNNIINVQSSEKICKNCYGSKPLFIQFVG